MRHLPLIVLLFLFPCLPSCVFFHHEPPEADVPNVRAYELPGGVQLVWKAVPGADKYGIWRRETGQETWNEIGETTMLMFVDDKARPGIVEEYAVRSYRGNKLSGFDPVYAKAEPGLGVPNTQTQTLPGGVLLTWNAIDGATIYSVRRLVSKEKEWVDLGATTSLFLWDGQAKPGTTEYYAVQSWQGKERSAYCLVPGVAAPPLVAPNVEVVGGTCRVTLSWKAIPEAERYIVCRRGVTPDSWIELASTTSPRYVDRRARAGVEEIYVVRACRGKMYSESAVISGTALAGPQPPKP